MKQGWQLVAAVAAIGLTAISASAAESPPKPPTAQLSVLRVALPSVGNESLDPTLGDGPGKQYLPLIFDYLIGETADGASLSKDTGLAENWTVSADRLTYTFRLRQGPTFQQGYGPVTAADVKFSLLRETRPAATGPRSQALRKMIDTIETPNDRTVVVRLHAPALQFLDFLSRTDRIGGMVVSEKYFQKVGEDYFKSHPVGSGPYELVSHSPGASFEFNLRPDQAGLWRVTPGIKKIVLQIVPEEGTRRALLQTGAIDIGQFAPATTAQLKKAGDRFRIFVKPNASSVALHLWNAGEASNPLRNPLVRQAIAVAIDKDAIAKTIYSGTATPADQYPLDPTEISYKKKPVYPYDPALAKKLLAQAGYPNGLSLTFWNHPQLPAIGADPHFINAAIAGFLAPVGITAQFRSMDYGAFRQMVVSHTVPGGVSVAGAAQGRVKWIFDDLYATSAGAMSTTADPKLDDLVAAAGKQTTEEGYVAAMQPVNDYIYNNFVFVPLVYNQETYVGRPDVVCSWVPRGAYDTDLDAVIPCAAAR